EERKHPREEFRAVRRRLFRSRVEWIRIRPSGVADKMRESGVEGEESRQRRPGERDRKGECRDAALEGGKNDPADMDGLQGDEHDSKRAQRATRTLETPEEQ